MPILHQRTQIISLMSDLKTCQELWTGKWNQYYKAFLENLQIGHDIQKRLSKIISYKIPQGIIDIVHIAPSETLKFRKYCKYSAFPGLPNFSCALYLPPLPQTGK